VVVEDGPWDDPRSCWFNSLYLRVVPSHAIELTAAMLDRGVARTLANQGFTTATLQQQQDLAAVIHLCGAGAGAAYARRGFRLTAGQQCGDHDVRAYLVQVIAGTVVRPAAVVTLRKEQQNEKRRGGARDACGWPAVLHEAEEGADLVSSSLGCCGLCRPYSDLLRREVGCFVPSDGRAWSCRRPGSGTRFSGWRKVGTPAQGDG
jgi:uncharacterized protein YndB with AHSA1/START domain